ncbi:hypothetical protein ZOSMA_171G00330 [Zostera marina]|uniref:Uncharacterized protein n=1 Tax=Zostera marina TaxID=29655 RepID=A0A0K9PUP3_ZOSMR|nr:hypothetical protein ZOSMA_171G00330 [Zostera marina]
MADTMMDISVDTYPTVIVYTLEEKDRKKILERSDLSSWFNQAMNTCGIHFIFWLRLSYLPISSIQD